MGEVGELGEGAVFGFVHAVFVVVVCATHHLAWNARDSRNIVFVTCGCCCSCGAARRS